MAHDVPHLGWFEVTAHHHSPPLHLVNRYKLHKATDHLTAAVAAAMGAAAVDVVDPVIAVRHTHNLIEDTSMRQDRNKGKIHTLTEISFVCAAQQGVKQHIQALGISTIA